MPTKSKHNSHINSYKVKTGVVCTTMVMRAFSYEYRYRIQHTATPQFTLFSAQNLCICFNTHVYDMFPLSKIYQYD